MKKINDYWVDDNNNKWNCGLYTKEQAKKYSETLINCRKCINCSYCSDCFNCSSFSYCFNCYVTPRIGSRNSQTYFYWLNNNIRVICGCWESNLKDFEKRVKEVHGNNRYGKQYMREIQIVKNLIKGVK